MDALDNEIPPGVPGRVAVCELCGRYFNNFQLTGDMKWCPRCNKASLRSDCPKCGSDIPVPPQLKCFHCGSWLTIYPMVQLQDGSVVPADVQEPDATVRKQLESEGGHWQDVIKGKSKGPIAPVPEAVKAKPPEGWEPKDFAELLSKTLIEQGLAEPAVAPEVWYCETCKVPQIHWGVAHPLCIICKGALVPETGQGLDKGEGGA